MAKKNMASMLDSFESDTTKEHDESIAIAMSVQQTKQKRNKRQASTTSLVSMKPEEKERFTKIAEDHGLSLSAFFRLAVNEYIENHNWE